MLHPWLCPLPVPTDPGDEPLFPDLGHQPGSEEITHPQRRWGTALLHPAAARSLGSAPSRPCTKGPAPPIPGVPARLGSVATAGTSRPLACTTCEKTHVTPIEGLPGTGVIRRTAAGPGG